MPHNAMPQDKVAARTRQLKAAGGDMMLASTAACV